MVAQAPVWFETQYAQRAMAIYQQKGNVLRPMVSQAIRFEGSEKAIFRLAGKSKAYKKTRNQRNIPSNAERKKFEVLLETWKVFDLIEEEDLVRMNVDEREAVYEAGAMALGRATDIEIYAKMGAAVASGAAIDYSAGAFSAASALDLCSRLQNQKVPWNGEVYCGLPSLQWNQLLANKVVNSADHVNNDLPFTKATDTRFWNGVNWFLMVEEDPQDLYPVPDTNKQDLFIWHKSAVGWGNHTDMSVKIDWDNYEDVWTVNMTARGAATVMQEGNGIVRFRTSTNSAIAIV